MDREAFGVIISVPMLNLASLTGIVFTIASIFQKSEALRLATQFDMKRVAQPRRKRDGATRFMFQPHLMVSIL